MKKKFLTFILSICLVIPALFIVSACSDTKNNEDEDVVKYTVTYDYNTTLNLEELMTNYKTSESIEHNKAILNMPSLDNEDFEGYFLGWYIKGTDEKIENNDVIDENVTLEARWNNKFRHGCSYSDVVDGGYELAIDCTNNPIVIVPEVFNGPSGEKNVVQITSSVDSRQEYLEQVVLPSTLKVIYGYTFENCTSLSEIVIPNSVTSIGGFAFYNCTSLSEIVIPNSVTSIGNSAFCGCTSLESIIVDSNNTVYDSRENCNAIIETNSNTLVNGCKTTKIPNSVTSIGNDAFRDCTSLSEIVIPNSVTSIGNNAFRNCTSLSEIVIPNSVKSIDSSAFFGCTSLESIIVDSNNTVYDSRENCNAIIETNSNTLVCGCKTTKIPNSVKSIGIEAFYNCTSLSEIVIPNSVTSIGNNAFSNCTSLSEIVIPASVETIGYNAFYNCTSLSEIVIPNSVTSIRNGTFDGCTSLSEIVIPNSVTSIGDNAFENCTSLSEIVIPNSVTSIGGFAFYNCTSLSEIVIPASVETIGNDAFHNCTSLSEIVIPASVETIGNYAFYNCTSLSEIVIPASVETIGNNAFSGCTSLESIIVDSNNTVYDSRENCNAIIETNSNTLVCGCKTTKIPNSVTSIGYYAFSNCTSLSEIVIPNSVTSISSKAFENCTSLTSIIIDSSVIANGIIGSNSMGAFVDNAVNIYIKTGLDTAQSTYLLNYYTRQATTDKTGYDKWVRNA